jgi:hypothetical protein
MDRLEVQAREAVRSLGHRGRTQRIPTVVRERVVAYARVARARGVSWRRIARAVGLSTAGVQRFAAARHSHPHAALVPVVVQALTEEGPPAGAGLSLLTPSGHRLERLSLEQALVLLRALG